MKNIFETIHQVVVDRIAFHVDFSLSPSRDNGGFQGKTFFAFDKLKKEERITEIV